jgi:hypothetical protein
MHSPAWANASPAMDLFGDVEVGTLVSSSKGGWTVVHENTVCRLPGCNKPHERAGQGYCNQHARNLYRCGHPEGAVVKAKEALYEAAHAYGDVPETETWVALCAAGIRYGVVRDNWLAPFKETCLRQLPEALVSVEGRWLRDAALAYTECEAEAPLTDFTRLKSSLEMAAFKFTKSLLSDEQAEGIRARRSGAWARRS